MLVKCKGALEDARWFFDVVPEADTIVHSDEDGWLAFSVGGEMREFDLVNADGVYNRDTKAARHGLFSLPALRPVNDPCSTITADCRKELLIDDWLDLAAWLVENFPAVESVARRTFKDFILQVDGLGHRGLRLGVTLVRRRTLLEVQDVIQSLIRLDEYADTVACREYYTRHFLREWGEGRPVREYRTTHHVRVEPAKEIQPASVVTMSRLELQRQQHIATLKQEFDRKVSPRLG